MIDCRTCLEQISSKDRVNIESHVVDEIDVLQAIQEVAFLKGSHDDCLPKCICKKCFELLKSTTIFRRMIINSFNQLMDKLKIHCTNQPIFDENNVPVPAVGLEDVGIKHQNQYKLEDVAIDVALKSNNVKTECSETEDESVTEHSMENKVYSVQSNCDISDLLLTDDDNSTSNLGTKRIKHLWEDTTFIKEEQTFTKKVKFVRKLVDLPNQKMHTKRTRKKIKLEKVEISTNTKMLEKSKNQECALNELSDGVELSLQKLEDDTNDMPCITQQSNEAYGLKTGSNKMASQACKVCGIILKGKKKYNLHMKIHNTEMSPQDYGCSICPKRYARKEYLSIHTRSHTGEKPYRCNLCNKNFSQSSTYYVHKRRLHDKVVQGTCSYCGKIFVDKPELDVHIKLYHTGERPYLCEFCSAAFVCNRTLQRHRKEIHTEKKPCQKCGKMLGDYALQKHLVRHQVLEEGLKIVRKKYTCEYCKTVMNFTSRRRHLKKQHGIILHGRGNDCTKVPIKEHS